MIMVACHDADLEFSTFSVTCTSPQKQDSTFHYPIIIFVLRLKWLRYFPPVGGGGGGGGGGGVCRGGPMEPTSENEFPSGIFG